ncbi:uncharacterized protein GGS25DRAFT_265874 [Hypoxylon fragiforme]|uniref:uncharacterized protein n=1 Tax=Hypoxylon fragiforme TaxID=63214 RepID=UPI0020C676BA|nr:uncharacterized protein GGS25DRAFT_265874 [Hypoxylon fragiforme]KAI2608227.1 hypothetical protein GGS25DRAFT_265874 [Hypoxylon fragiforme]
MISRSNPHLTCSSFISVCMRGTRPAMAATQKNPVEIEKASSLAHVPLKSEEFEKMISGML